MSAIDHTPGIEEVDGPAVETFDSSSDRSWDGIARAIDAWHDARVKEGLPFTLAADRTEPIDVLGFQGRYVKLTDGSLGLLIRLHPEMIAKTVATRTRDLSL
jgi:hypothetical protein